MFIRSDGLLVKRTRTGRDLRLEAEMMVYLSGHGIPVPRVHDVTADELVMQYVPGPRMSEEIGRKPWLAAQLGRELADLHRSLDTVRAPDFLAGDGDLLHLDLHPGNVVLGPEGPVVLDWASAIKGDRRLDVALSWVSLAVARLAPVRKLTRWRFLRAFMANADPKAHEAIPEAARIRLERHDRDPVERAALQKLMDRERR